MRSAILCTCTSTQIPEAFPQPTFMTRYAIFGPTPGSSMSVSTDGGMSELSSD